MHIMIYFFSDIPYSRKHDSKEYFSYHLWFTFLVWAFRFLSRYKNLPNFPTQIRGFHTKIPHLDEKNTTFLWRNQSISKIYYLHFYQVSKNGRVWIQKIPNCLFSVQVDSNGGSDFSILDISKVGYLFNWRIS